MSQLVRGSLALTQGQVLKAEILVYCQPKVFQEKGESKHVKTRANVARTPFPVDGWWVFEGVVPKL